jgi:hypothetical protein
VQVRRTQPGPLAPGRRDRADHAALAGQRGAADRDPLVHQRRLRHPPAVADLPEAVRVGNPHVGEEDLVELGLARDLAQRPHLDARVRHVAHEVRDALVLGDVRVRAGDQDRPARVVGVGRPHLLAGDDPVVAVPHRAGAQARQVGAGTGLAEQLAPDLFAGPQRAQEAGLLVLGAVAEDRGRGHAEADADPARFVVRRPGGRQFGVHDPLQRAGCAQAAEALRVVHPRQARVEPGPQEVQAVRRRRIVRGEQRAHALAQLLRCDRHAMRPSASA